VYRAAFDGEYCMTSQPLYVSTTANFWSGGDGCGLCQFAELYAIYAYNKALTTITKIKGPLIISHLQNNGKENTILTPVYQQKTQSARDIEVLQDELLEDKSQVL